MNQVVFEKQVDNMEQLLPAKKVQYLQLRLNLFWLVLTLKLVQDATPVTSVYATNLIRVYPIK